MIGDSQHVRSCRRWDRARASATSRCSTNGSTVVVPRPRNGCRRCCTTRRSAPRRRSPSATSRRASTPTGSPRCGAAEHGLAFGRLDAEDGEVALRRQARPARRGRRVQLAADGLAGPRGPALLHGHGRVAGRHAPASAPAHPPSRGHRHRRRDPRPRRRPCRGRRPGQRAHQRGRAARRRWARAAPGGWPTSSPRSRPSRTRSSGRSPRACWWCRAAPAPARPPWRCTGPRTCSTPTATGWPAAACSWSGPTPRSCATSGRCCRRWARRASCSAPSGSSSRVWTRDGPSRRRSPRSRGGAEMAGVIAAAVRDRQQLPRRPVAAGRRAAGGARSTARSSTPPAPGPAARASRTTRAKRIFHQEADPAAGRAGRALDRARRAAAARRGRPRRIRDELKESRELARELDALWPTLSAEQLLGDLYADPRRLARGHPAPARRRPRAAGPAAARRRRAGRPALDPGRRAAARRGRRAARRRRRRGRRPRGRRAARGGHVRPGRARRARPGGGPRPRAAARHRRDRRRPARRAPGRAPLRLHGRPGRRRPRVGLRARDRRRGAGAVGRWRGGWSCAGARPGR